MLKKDELKEKVHFHLINFSKTKWLSSEYFFEQLEEKFNRDDRELYKEQLIRFKHFQRELADAIQSIFIDQMTYKQFLVISSNKGYKIATNEEECLHGKNYLYSKIDEQLQRIKFIDVFRLEKFAGKNKEQDIFSTIL
jgi:hypothetical protein